MLLITTGLMVAGIQATTDSSAEKKDAWITNREWPYLTSEVLKTRYAIVAYLLRDYATIVEIGGYKTPISDFVSGKKIIVIDPKIAAKKDSNVTHLSIKLQNWDEKEIENSKYALIILGMDLRDMDDIAWEKLFSLINNATAVILEFSSSYKLAQQQFNSICKKTSKKINMTIKLDLSKNDGSKYHEFYPFREIYFLS